MGFHLVVPPFCQFSFLSSIKLKQISVLLNVEHLKYVYAGKSGKGTILYCIEYMLMARRVEEDFKREF